MTLVVLNILVALANGFGAVQELIVSGIWGRNVQAFLMGVGGIVVSVLFIVSGVAMWRKWPNARSLVIFTAVLSILFHVYAALPPHRNVGFPALIIGAGYGLVLLIITLSKGKKAESAIS
jgi:hypothetical protein